jgi:hypothetical protein
MECKFMVGQKVVCIDAKHHPEWSTGKTKYRTVEQELELGKIYTIREIFMNLTFNSPCLRLEGIVRETGKMRGTPFEMGFDYRRFAPLKEKKTDISIFTEILNKVNDGNHDNPYNFCLDELFETVKK